MKKHIAYLTVSVLAILAGFGIIALANSLTTPNSNALENTLAVTTEENNTPLNITNTLAPSDETVYIITDTNGTATKTFIGSDLYTEQKPLPVTLDITYYLNGSQISPSDLVGQSGHVKISYHYNATATYQGKSVPFVTATGLQLDGTKFSNVKLSNGKIISEDNNYTILGYSLVGLNENLGIDLLPSTFTIEADTTDFKLDNSYTFATNDILADLDTSKLSSIDSIISSINQLSDGLDQIIAGSTKLDSGLSSLVDGVTRLQSAAEALNSGANELANGLSVLNDKVSSTLAPNLELLKTSLNALSEKSSTLNDGVQGTFTTLLNNLQDIASASTDPITAASLSQIISSTSAKLPTLYTKLGTYTGTVDQIANKINNLDTDELTNGVAALSDGASQLASGTIELKNGVDQLASGATQLAQGSKALNSGLQTFKSTGIDRLTSFANNDLANFTANFRASVNAAKSYHSYSNPNAKSVKFIFKTAGIK